MLQMMKLVQSGLLTKDGQFIPTPSECPNCHNADINETFDCAYRETDMGTEYTSQWWECNDCGHEWDLCESKPQPLPI